eukprot:COSAG02_NODE_3248_length_7097_cov_2.679194_2_plen_74_part_00
MHTIGGCRPVRWPSTVGLRGVTKHSKRNLHRYDVIWHCSSSKQSQLQSQRTDYWIVDTQSKYSYDSHKEVPQT